MAQTRTSRRLNAAPDKVWALLANPSRFEEWLTVHTKWAEEPPTQLSVGTKMVEVLTIMGMPNTITFTVDQYESPKTTTFSGSGMAGATITFTLSVEPDGAEASIATIDAEFVSQMMVGAIGGAIERASAKELGDSLDNLAGLLD